MPELRRDPIGGGWIIVSTERLARPSDFKTVPQEQQQIKICPFCEGNEHLTPSEIFAYRKDGSQKDSVGWWIRGFPNTMPILTIEEKLFRKGLGLYDIVSGVGAHEIIVETPNHNDTFATMDNNQIEKIFWAYRDRILDLKKDKRFRYILVFKNHGPAAGASTIVHLHSQIMALPITPKKMHEELKGCKTHFLMKERCIYCDIITQEISFAKRVICENSTMIAISPYASRFPFEIWILPRKHLHNFTHISKEEIMDLARITKSIFSRLFNLLGNPSFNYILHDVPNIIPQRGYWETIEFDFHWHIEIIPRITRIAGFEWGTGFYINPVTPEDATKSLIEMGGGC